MNKKRILVVDDEREVLEAIAFQLFVHGFEVTKALSGQQMLDLLRDFKPDLVLIDQMMPGLSGVETVNAARELPNGAKLPVVLMSPSPEPKVKVVTWNKFLRKPFTLDQVLESVATSLKEVPAATPI